MVFRCCRLGTRLLCAGTFYAPMVKKHFFVLNNRFFFQKEQFLNFFSKNISLLNKSFFPEKKAFQAKKFFFDENVNFFEDFHLTLVKKNRQNREHFLAYLDACNLQPSASNFVALEHELLV